MNDACLRSIYVDLYIIVKELEMNSVHERFFATSDILTNIFLINAGHFYITSDFLTMNKAEMFIKAQLKLVKMTSRMLPNVRQM